MTAADASTAVAATDASAGAPAEASASPFTMVTGAPGAMVCEGDVCFVPGADAATE
ncbi:hypothetical protein [Agromyces soli]|uniref:Uncharacterized protein n=1 Tax=Agromyces soli TaxID=659012 RepID=A0ABY4AR42_9MICO|nr:hypothetical protein [Agromyces soli]UOE25603.1 hypothetical protein MTP13_14900 [Agromyces soli]